MHKILHKGMQLPNVRETAEPNEREHAMADSPAKADESPERTIEESSENAETDKEERL